MFQFLSEEVELLIVMLFLPISIERFQNFLVVVEHFNEIRLKIFRLIQDIAFLIAFLHRQFNNLVKFHFLCLQLFHIQFRCNNHLVFGKHL